MPQQRGAPALSHRHNATLPCQPLTVPRVLRPASVAQNGATTRFCPHRGHLETGQILLRLDAGGPFGLAREFGSARPRPRPFLRCDRRNRGLPPDQGVWRTTEAHPSRVLPRSSRVNGPSHPFRLQRKCNTEGPFFQSVEKVRSGCTAARGNHPMVGQVAVLIRGAPHILWIEKRRVAVGRNRAPTLCPPSSAASKTIVGRLLRLEASSRRRLTKRIGTNPGSDQKLILPLIIVADMVKRYALCAILGEIGVVVSSDC